MAAEPTRSSQRIADRLPTQDAPYLQKPFYTLVGAHLARQANTLTENQVKVFWGEALRLYFSQDDAFSADVEGYTEGLRRADLIIFFVGEYDESGLQIEKPWLVMEVKGATPTAPVGWHAEQESMQYAKELCETYGVNGIWCGAAEGRRVLFHKFVGGQREQLPSSKPNHRFSPMDIIDDQRFIHEMLTTIRQTRPFR